MKGVSSIVRIKPEKLGHAAVAGCLLFLLAILLVIKPVLSPISFLCLKIPSSLDMKEKQETYLSHSEDSNIKQRANKSVIESPIQKGKIACDYTQPRSDTCFIDGEIRIIGDSSAIIIISPSQLHPENVTWKIRPNTRKWEAPVMESIKEFPIKSSSANEQVPHCMMNHDVPAIIFSTGGFLGNIFHDFTDVLIPLFITSHHYNGKVQFLITDFNWKWIHKYQPILKHLSQYQIINLDTENMVHCFRYAHVGLKSHKVLGIDPSKSPNGYSMSDFRVFIRSCFSLKRVSTTRISKRKPRLLIILRKGSRSLANEREIIAMAQEVGYKVIAIGPEETKNVSRFAQIVNSCDVIMGVHGAGLTNMIFLPINATLVQVIPWGELKWACKNDFGDPAPDMGIRYLDYEIKEEESSLIEKYPRDHAVFKDILSIHKQGWNALWSIFLNEQKVNLDVHRFRHVLLQIFQSLIVD